MDNPDESFHHIMQEEEARLFVIALLDAQIAFRFERDAGWRFTYSKADEKAVVAVWRVIFHGGIKDYLIGKTKNEESAHGV